MFGSGSGTLLSAWQWHCDTCQLGSGTVTLLSAWQWQCETVVCLELAVGHCSVLSALSVLHEHLFTGFLSGEFVAVKTC